MPERLTSPATQNRNRLLFALPLGGAIESEIFQFFLGAFNNRHVIMQAGQYITLAHNLLVHRALEADANVKGGFWDYLVFVEWDHLFDSDQVWAAIEAYDHRSHPVVAHLYFSRGMPVLPVGYNFDAEKKAFHPLSEDQIVLWKQLRPGLHPADGIPMGLTAIHKSVFGRLKEHDPDSPFFAAPVGKTGLEGMSDDIYFSMRCREAGIPLHFDTRFDIKHVGRIQMGAEMYFQQMVVLHEAERNQGAPDLQVVKSRIETPRLEVVRR